MLGTSLSACTSDADEAREDGAETAEPAMDDGASSMPSIYVDRKVEHLIDGVNTLLEGYQQQVSSCREAGLPTRPLSGEDEARIGTERWQFWRTSEQLAYRVEAWEVTSGEISKRNHCKFTLIPSGYHVYYDAEKTLELNLATGERLQGPPEPDELQVYSAEPDAEDLARWGNGAGPSSTSVLGQPCKEWRSPRGDISCYWSGGVQWGFSYISQGIFASNAGFSTGGIVLEAEPAPGVAGDRLTTTQFVVGSTLDTADMLPGAN